MHGQHGHRERRRPRRPVGARPDRTADRATPAPALAPLPGDDERYHLVGGNDQLVSGMIAALPPETVRHGHVARSRSAAERGPLDRRSASHGRRATVERPPTTWCWRSPSARCAKSTSRSPGSAPRSASVIRDDGHGHERQDPPRTVPQDLAGARLLGGDLRRMAAPRLRLGRLRASSAPDARTGAVSRLPRRRAGRHRPRPGPPTAPRRPADVALRPRRARARSSPAPTAAFTGRAYEDHWALDPWSTAPTPTTGSARRRATGRSRARTEGRILFAGEHTSVVNIGFLDGAVETGERAPRCRRLG